MPEITASSQVDTDFIEDLLPPIATDTDQHSMFIERSRRVMEMCWTTGRRDGSSHFDGRGSDNDGRGEDEDEDEPLFLRLWNTRYFYLGLAWRRLRA